MINNLPASAGDARDMDLILAQKDPWSKKLQSTPVFCLENSMDRGAWQATVHGVTKSCTHTHRHLNIRDSLCSSYVGIIRGT